MSTAAQRIAMAAEHGPVHAASVRMRGGHEFTGGAVAWDPVAGDRPPCPGCALCAPADGRREWSHGQLVTRGEPS